MNFDKLVIHPATRSNLQIFLNQSTHALLLTGDRGVGLGTIARTVAKHLAGANSIILTPDERGKTAVEPVRKLYDLARGKQSTPFVIVIDDSDSMTAAAQNALLKLLEEPTENLHFILTTHKPLGLLPTVISRTQIIEVLPTSANDLLDGVKITPTKRAQALFMASNYPAEMSRLMSNDDYFRARARVTESAKAFLAANLYERLVMVSKLKTRDEALAMAEALAALISFMLEKNADVRLSDNLLLTSQVIDNLSRNGNVRAQMTYLATNVI